MVPLLEVVLPSHWSEIAHSFIQKIDINSWGLGTSFYLEN